jgi:putative phosphoesterase
MPSKSAASQATAELMVQVPAAGPPRIGVISDTHGRLDPYILALFAGVDLIVHAGDVGGRSVLDALEAIAPTIAIAGNLDGADVAELPSEAAGEIGGIRFVVGHKRKRLMKRLEAGRPPFVGGPGACDLIIFGHDHVPSAFWVEQALWLNPGSASAPYEEDDVPTVAIVEGGPTGLCVRFIPLTRPAPSTTPSQAKSGRGKSSKA